MTEEQKIQLQMLFNKYTISNYFMATVELKPYVDDFFAEENREKNKGERAFALLLERLEEIAKKRKAEAEVAREEDYQKACEQMKSEENQFVGEDNPLLLAAKKFHAIGAYKNCRALEEECRKQYADIEADITFSRYSSTNRESRKRFLRKEIILLIIFVVFVSAISIPALLYYLG